MKTAKQKSPQKRADRVKSAAIKPQLSYALPASLNIHTVEVVAKDLASLGLSDAQEGVDASATEFLTSAGIQLLISYDHSLRASGSRLKLRHPRPELEDSFRTLGLQSIWQDWTSNDTPQTEHTQPQIGETHE